MWLVEHPHQQLCRDLPVPAEILRGTAVALGMDRRTVASGAHLGFITLRRAFEKPGEATTKTLAALAAYFEAKGATFLASTQSDGPGVQMAAEERDFSACVLKGARTSINLPQRELASYAKVAPRTLSRIETGRPVRRDAIVKIIQALGREGVTIIEEDDGACKGFRVSLERIARKDLRF